MAEGSRSWNSVCGQCVHFTRPTCAGRKVSARDSLAAICRRFEPNRKTKLHAAPDTINTSTGKQIKGG